MSECQSHNDATVCAECHSARVSKLVAERDALVLQAQRLSGVIFNVPGQEIIHRGKGYESVAALVLSLEDDLKAKDFQVGELRKQLRTAQEVINKHATDGIEGLHCVDCVAEADEICDCPMLLPFWEAMKGYEEEGAESPRRVCWFAEVNPDSKAACSACKDLTWPRWISSKGNFLTDDPHEAKWWETREQAEAFCLQGHVRHWHLYATEHVFMAKRLCPKCVKVDPNDAWAMPCPRHRE